MTASLAQTMLLTDRFSRHRFGGYCRIRQRLPRSTDADETRRSVQLAVVIERFAAAIAMPDSAWDCLSTEVLF